MAGIGSNIEFATALLTQNKLVAIPTDTVYGLAGNATNEKVIEAIFAVKQRSSDKPLIIQTHSLKKASLFLKSVPTDAHVLATKFWPGALTLVMDANDSLPKNLLASDGTVGVRVPNHPATLEILKGIDFPLAVTSANLSGHASPKTALEVKNQIGDKIDYIFDGGPSDIGLESTIVGFKDEKPVILRAGAISEQEIFDALK